MSHYDYIIAGGGAAGLSLAYHLIQEGLTTKTILIIDADKKTHNDRTWCFWTRKPFIYDNIVRHCWKAIELRDKNTTHVSKTYPYRYCMIRGIDFYQYVGDFLRKQENIVFQNTAVTSISSDKPAAVYTAEGNTYHADYVFDSLIRPKDFTVDTKRYYYLKQHFLGWRIRTEKPVFHPGTATLFDMRTYRKNVFSFMYLLPVSSTESLVEYTIFSRQLLEKHEYESALRDYIRRFLCDTSYKILEHEEGIIPMTDMYFPRKKGDSILYIGTKGGQVKSSSGFAFFRIQEDSQCIARSLHQYGHPFHRRTSPLRYRLFDSILLSTLTHFPVLGKKIFLNLFTRNNTADVFHFLDEKAPLSQNLSLMRTMPAIPFCYALLHVVWRFIRFLFFVDNKQSVWEHF